MALHVSCRCAHVIKCKLIITNFDYLQYEVIFTERVNINQKFNYVNPHSFQTLCEDQRIHKMDDAPLRTVRCKVTVTLLYVNTGDKIEKSHMSIAYQAYYMII